MKNPAIYLLLVFVLSFTCCKGGKGLSGSGNTGSDSAASQVYYKMDQLRYEDYVYKKGIRTVMLHEKSWELSPPLIRLGSDQQLMLSFDDLDANLKNYSYTLVHCNADWQPSELIFSEFADGFQENYINGYQYSFNTIQRFTHYNIVFPNDNLRLTKTGNYIVKVYLDGDQENLVLTRRFMVFDERVEIKASMRQPMNEYRNYKQEVDFIVKHTALDIRNPYGDLQVVLMQNDRWDNVITGLKPVFIRDKELSYEFDNGENAFWGGNEYRHFDIKSLRYQTDRIRDIKTDSATNYVYLVSDEKRQKRYYSKSDINGKYLVKVQEGNRSEVEADYAWVNFFLPWGTPMSDADIYVFGALSNWGYSADYKMKYNYERFGYEANIFLKQGYYNYEYQLMKDGAKTGDVSSIEGSYYDTENDYTVLIYHRATGTDYDQLIGVKRINSIKPF
jgi:hypothetical protein